MSGIPASVAVIPAAPSGDSAFHADPTQIAQNATSPPIPNSISVGFEISGLAYDPVNNAWTVLPSLPVARNHVSGFSAGGAACVAGGRSPTTARVDCFDPAAGAWSRLPDLPQPASGAGATTFESGGVVMAGGQDASETRIVDQLAFYSPGSTWISPDKMMSPRHGFELAVFEGRAWACGGGSAPGLHPVATCTSLGDRPSPNN